MSKLICIIGADPYSRNFGVRALFEGLVSVIDMTFPDARINLMLGSRQAGVKDMALNNRAGYEEVVVEFSKRVYRKNHILFLLFLAAFFRIAPTRRMKDLIASSNMTFKKMVDADIVCSIGAGDSFSDLYGLVNLIYVALPQLLFLLMGKPVYQMPQSYGPFNLITARMIARFTLRRSKVVLVRELLSYDYLQKASIVKNPIFCYDLGFLMDPKKASAVRPDLKEGGFNLGLNVSGMLYFGGYVKEEANPFGIKEPYKDTICAMLVFMFEKWQDLNVYLVTHVPGKHFQSDELACERVFESMRDRYPGRLRLITGELNHRETKHIIGEMDVFIGSRMHACIAAISQSVPTVSLGYSDKFRGVMESIGYLESVVDLRTEGLSDVKRRLEKTMEKLSENRRRLTSSVEKIEPEIRRVMGSVFDA